MKRTTTLPLVTSSALSDEVVMNVGGITVRQTVTTFKANLYLTLADVNAGVIADIAALTPVNKDILQFNGTTYTNKTPVQYYADLYLAHKNYLELFDDLLVQGTVPNTGNHIQISSIYNWRSFTVPTYVDVKSGRGVVGNGRGLLSTGTYYSTYFFLEYFNSSGSVILSSQAGPGLMLLPNTTAEWCCVYEKGTISAAGGGSALCGFFVSNDMTTTQTGGIYFEVTDSTNIMACSRSAAGAAGVTKTNTGVSWTDLTYKTFKIVTGADSTTVQFYIDSVLVATHNTNTEVVRTGTLRFGIGVGYMRVSGTVFSHAIYLDYLYYLAPITRGSIYV